MILQIDSAGWVAIIGAIATASTVIAGAAVLVIVALGNLNKKVDVAANRREEIANSPAGTPIPPSTLTPPKE